MLKSKTFFHHACFWVILLSILVFSVNAFAVTVRLNNVTLYYDKIIYVDVAKGSDTTGDGSATKPYASVAKAVDNVTVNKTAIKIAPGTYNETVKPVPGSYLNEECAVLRPTPNMDYDLIGDPANPPVVVLLYAANNYRQNVISQSANTLTTTHTYRMYDLIFKTAPYNFKVYSDLACGFPNTIEIYNCVFDNYNNGIQYLFYFNGGSYGTNTNIQLKIYNSVLQGQNLSYHNGNGNLSLTNSIIQTTYGATWASINNGMTYKANQCVVYPNNYNTSIYSGTFYTANPNLDTKYHVLNANYQHKGVGTNPDGSQAEIGVYGGDFAWGGNVQVESPQLARVTGGYGFSAVIKDDKTLSTFGYNENGRLGIGNTVSQSVPVKVGTSANWDKISALWNHTVAVQTDGTLWAWGANQSGQLGDGTTIDRYVPVQIGTATNWAQVAAGYQHTVALKKDGTLWAWGSNTYGQLGNGTYVDKLTPTQIGTATDWLVVTTGSYHVVALKKDGSLWAFGDNRYYQLGDGSTTGKNVPTRIGTATDWLMVSAASGHTLALKTDGSLWGWGRQGYGELGDGTTNSRQIPTKIGLAADWASVVAIWNHTAAIKKDGSLWAWGWNYYGQLGNGTTADSYIPLRIGTATDWLTVSGGDAHTVALKKDGTIWTWGFNGYGQLGNGTVQDSAVPGKI